MPKKEPVSCEKYITSYSKLGKAKAFRPCGIVMFYGQKYRNCINSFYSTHLTVIGISLCPRALSWTVVLPDASETDDKTLAN